MIAAVETLDCPITSMGSGLGANIAIGASAGFSYALKLKKDELGNPIPNCPLPEIEVFNTFSGNAFNGNKIIISWGIDSEFAGQIGHNSASISFSLLNSFGPPTPLVFMPDDTEIIEAWMEVTCTGLTRTRSYIKEGTGDCDGPIEAGYYPPDNVELEDMSYSFVGLTGPDSFEVLGAISGARNNLQSVVDCTDIMKIMFADRAVGNYAYGYGVIVLPSSIVGSGSVADLVPSTMPAIHTAAGECYPCGETSYMRERETIVIEWGGISIGKVHIKIRYSDIEKQRIVESVRLPDMGD